MTPGAVPLASAHESQCIPCSRSSMRPPRSPGEFHGQDTEEDPARVDGSLTDEQAQTLAEQILALTAGSLTKLMVAVGELILVGVFNNDEALWHSKSPTKGESLRKLAGQPGMADASWGETKLHEAGDLYLLSNALGGFAPWPHLQYSHLVVVCGLPSDQQKKLLTQAESNGWTVAQLKQAAGIKSSGSGKGASPVTAVARAVRQVAAWSDSKVGLVAVASAAGIDSDTRQLAHAGSGEPGRHHAEDRSRAEGEAGEGPARHRREDRPARDLARRARGSQAGSPRRAPRRRRTR